MITIKEVKNLEWEIQNNGLDVLPSEALDMINRILSQHAEIQRLKKRIKNLKEWDR
jgi:hypothetical protein